MNNIIGRIVITGLAAGLFSQGVCAQEALPDPSTITLPDVTSDDVKKLQKQGHKFFYFHSADVSFAEAHEDLSYCRRYLEIGAGYTLPGFVPWVEPVDREIEYGPNPYGLVGAIMASILAGPMERGIRNNKMRMCMGPRGYTRYPLPEDAWKVLNDGEEKQLVLMQAKLASGPQPKAAEVAE